MQNHLSKHETSLRLALLVIVFILSFVPEVQSRVYADTITTMTVDTITTDSTYIITETTKIETTSIDSAYSKIQSNTDARNPLDVNDIKKNQEEQIELDSAMTSLSEGFKASAKMFEVFVSAMDSSILKSYIDSILTVSLNDLQAVIFKMNRCIQINDSSSVINGLDLVVKFVHVQMNGKKIDASELNPSFIKSVTLDDLKQTTANFTAIKDQIEILKSKPSGKIVASEISDQFLAPINDPLVVRIFKNAMSQARSAANNTNIRKVTNSVIRTGTYTVNRNDKLNQKP